MATKTATRGTGTFPRVQPESGQVAVAWGVYEIASALSQNDIVEFCSVPAGAIILDGYLIADDIDTGTEALEIDVGTYTCADTGVLIDADYLLDSGVITGDAVTNHVVGGVRIHFDKVASGPLTPSSTDPVRIVGTITAAANAGGTGTLYCYVLYTMA